MRFRKKPIVIEAIQFQGFTDGPNDLPTEIAQFIKDDDGVVSIKRGELVIRNLGGEQTASKGDWIIRGVQGELYPCKPDIFAATYEPVED
jgi:hypothetical protein